MATFLSYPIRVHWLILCLAGILAGSPTAAEQPLRTMRYTTRTRQEAEAWQREVRAKLFQLLKLEDLVAPRGSIPLNPATVSSESKNGYELREVEINSINLPALLAFFEEHLRSTATM